MRLSDEGLARLKEFEGFRAQAYLCPAGVWTVGYGHTANVEPGDVVSEEAAERLLRKDIAGFERGVLEALGGERAQAQQHEFDAMVLLAFNIGLGGFRKSTVLRRHRAGDREGAAAAFGMWVKATDPATGKKRTLNGLVRRRAVEADLYLGLLNEAPRHVAAEPAKPLAKSRTVGGAVAAIVATLGGVVADAQETLAPLYETLAGLGVEAEHLRLGLAGLALAGAALALWARLDDRRKEAR